MKISIKSTDLAHYLKTVSRVPQRKATDVYGHLLLEVSNEVLRLSAHNGQQQMALDVPADLYSLSGGGFSVCVPSNKFDQVISALPKGAMVTISYTEAKIVIASGRSRFSLATLPAEQFPVMEFSPEQSKGELLIPGATLSTAIHQVGFCAARTDVRTFLNGIFFEFHPGTMTLAASDGLRLGVVEVPVDGNPMQQFILPSACLEDVCQFLGTGEVQIATSGNMVRFSRAGGVLHTKLIDGNFPDYRKLIAAAQKGDLARVSRDEFAGAMARVGLLSEGVVSSVRLAVSADTISVQSVGGSATDIADDVLPCDYHAEPLEVGFNGALACEIVRSLGASEIEVIFTGAASGTLLRARDLPSHSFVLMPVRL
ncbi:DNA polymerase III subunit beta [Pseudomonas mosselii]|uniref:DNA polymerase III subunit beta n=1 Tax=Pseudomonas mosselii TaxID=78327 RepID=UPI0021D7E674|nr:DNA polymerase III subunit beta [Pseudomonas mosselii]MCU9528519.1 DNA polymerase III subunit beta [Pseudomonas mosselii]MCU9535853.1 DNA polymerase III subunit beta [Pseudomonas mosselii]MCU9542911.1 DNA polymerase III subunit beta [Pseudomonas mosselii]MCU9548792.1 DNA polymerase III subunit beta [Pseudomonas mosselii]